MRITGLSSCVAACVLLTMSTMAAAQVSMEKLGKGVNLSHWYAQWSDYDERRLATYFTEHDMKLVAQSGFTHVRLTLSDKVVFDAAAPGKLKPDAVQKLRQRIDRIVEHKLAVVVDFHPDEPYKRAASEDAGRADAFVADWSALARELSTADADWVALEIMNEPEPMKGPAWRELQARAIRAIRAAAPRHTIIANPGGWTGVKDLLEFSPYREFDNVIYTFHYYDPHVYTHQSASWGWSVAQRVAGLDWPIDPARATEASISATQANDDEARKHLKWQVENGWFTRDWIGQAFDQIAAWQKLNGDARVYLGEFGVYNKAAPRAGRLRWYQAVREEAERVGFGWAIWDYAGGFAVTIGEPGSRRADEELVRALGLR
jgi:endoglucanase